MADKDKQKYYWLKLDKDFFQKYQIKSLLSEKNGENFLIIYQQLMCECLNYVDEKNNGILRFSKQRAYTINELAYVLNRKPKQLEEALKTLINKELIEVWEDGTIYINNVNVGSITGQTLRKQKGINMVENTKKIPKNYQKKVVKNTLENRDKSIEYRDKNIEEDKYKREIDRFIESGINEQIIKKAEKMISNYEKTKDNLNLAIDILTNDDIANKDGYLYECLKGEL